MGGGAQEDLTVSAVSPLHGTALDHVLLHRYTQNRLVLVCRGHGWDEEGDKYDLVNRICRELLELDVDEAVRRDVHRMRCFQARAAALGPGTSSSNADFT